jgi:hypothetical protein
MEFMLNSRVQSFFDVNGMDVLNSKSIPTVLVVDGKEYSPKISVFNYLNNSYYAGLWRDLDSYVPTYVYNWKTGEFSK